MLLTQTKFLLCRRLEYKRVKRKLRKYMTNNSKNNQKKLVICRNFIHAFFINKNSEFAQLLTKYNKVSQYRDEEISKAKIEIVKIYTSILRQAKVIHGIENGKYSNGLVTIKLMDKIEIPSQSEFPMLFQTLKDKDGILLNENGQKYRKVDMQIYETEGFEELDQREKIKRILGIKENTEVRAEKTMSINKLYYMPATEDNKFFQTATSGRPVTEYFKQRGSTSNLQSKLMMTEMGKNNSLIKIGNFFSSRKKQSSRATSIPSTRSKSNTKMA